MSLVCYYFAYLLYTIMHVLTVYLSNYNYIMHVDILYHTTPYTYSYLPTPSNY